MGFIAQTFDRTFEDCAEQCDERSECIAFDVEDIVSKNACRLVHSVTGRNAPRNSGHHRQFCRLRYTCEDYFHPNAGGSCDDNQLAMPETVDCGIEECTKDKCCLDGNEITVCGSLNVCSNYDGICTWNGQRRKENFATIECDTEPCTKDECCKGTDFVACERALYL